MGSEHMVQRPLLHVDCVAADESEYPCQPLCTTLLVVLMFVSLTYGYIFNLLYRVHLIGLQGHHMFHRGPRHGGASDWKEGEQAGPQSLLHLPTHL